VASLFFSYACRLIADIVRAVFKKLTIDNHPIILIYQLTLHVLQNDNVKFDFSNRFSRIHIIVKQFEIGSQFGVDKHWRHDFTIEFEIFHVIIAGN
jgi:hypothetical protein